MKSNNQIPNKKYKFCKVCYMFKGNVNICRVCGKQVCRSCSVQGDINLCKSCYVDIITDNNNKNITRIEKMIRV